MDVQTRERFVFPTRSTSVKSIIRSHREIRNMRHGPPLLLPPSSLEMIHPEDSAQDLCDRRQEKKLLACPFRFSGPQYRRSSYRCNRQSSPQDHPERLGEAGASIAGGRQVSSRGIELPLPKGSLATASESTTIADYR